MKKLLFICICILSFSSIEAQNTFYKDGVEYSQVDQGNISLVTSLTFAKTSMGKCYKLYVSVVNTGDSSYDVDPNQFSAQLFNPKMKTEIPVEVVSHERFLQLSKERNIRVGVASGILAVGMGVVAGSARTFGGAVAAGTVSAASVAVGTGSVIDNVESRRLLWEQYLKRNTIQPGEEVGGFVYIKYQKTDQLHLIYKINGEEISVDYNIPLNPMFVR